MPAIKIDPAVLMGQSAEMSDLTEDYDHLFQSVASSLTTMNSHWSANLANNFAPKISSAKGVFSTLTSLLRTGSRAAADSARDFIAVDQTLVSIGETAIGYGRTTVNYFKGKTLKEIILEKLNQYKSAGDVTEDIIAIISKGGSFDGIPGAGLLESLEHIFKILELDETTPEGFLEKIRAGYLLLGGESMLAESTGLANPEAGLLIDLVTKELTNYTENQLDNLSLIQNMLTDKNMSWTDRWKTLNYIANNASMEKAGMEGMRDVIYDKADTIGSLLGLKKTIENATNGELHSVSDVWKEYFKTMQETVDQLGWKEMLRINGESLLQTLSDPTLGWKDLLSR